MTTTDRLTDAPLLVTLPRVLKSEAETLAALCRAGAGPIHIRKPESSAAEVEGLLRDLCAAGADMDCFTLHYDEPLARRYGLGGVHLRGERIAAGAGKGLRRSCSTHGWDEVERYGPVADYVFLSPLFDSISKAGYRSAVSLEEARSRLPLSEGRVVALGGVCAENIAWARLAGFDGVASLGAVWVTEGDRLDAQATVLRFLELRRKWRAAGGCLQLISDGNMSVAEAFLRGGGRWVQLRMKDTPAGQIVGRGRELLALCRAWGALLIVNDAPELSAEIGADGVHLGQGDMAPAEARRIVGAGAIDGQYVRADRRALRRADRLYRPRSVPLYDDQKKSGSRVGGRGIPVDSGTDAAGRDRAAGRRDRGHFARGRARADAFGSDGRSRERSPLAGRRCRTADRPFRRVAAGRCPRSENRSGEKKRTIMNRALI